jgi:hypothetical protein
MTPQERDRIEFELRRIVRNPAHWFINGPYQDGMYFAGAVDSLYEPSKSCCGKGRTSLEVFKDLNRK